MMRKILTLMMKFQHISPNLAEVQVLTRNKKYLIKSQKLNLIGELRPDIIRLFLFIPSFC